MFSYDQQTKCVVVREKVEDVGGLQHANDSWKIHIVNASFLKVSRTSFERRVPCVDVARG